MGQLFFRRAVIGVSLLQWCVSSGVVAGERRTWRGQEVHVVDDMVFVAPRLAARANVPDIGGRWKSSNDNVHIHRDHFTGDEVERIRATWAGIQNGTVVRFVEDVSGKWEGRWTGSVSYERVEADRCYTEFNVNGVVVNLGTGCMDTSTLQHETLHALGFHHEHTRPDRDQYVTIHWDNIAEANRRQFKISPYGLTLGQPYNYNGVMHYAHNEFAIDRDKPTISPKNDSITLRPGEMNDLDFEAVNLLFNCDTHVESKRHLHMIFVLFYFVHFRILH